MKSLIDYIITEGRKQKVTNWKQFNQEIKLKNHRFPDGLFFFFDVLSLVTR